MKNPTTTPQASDKNAPEGYDPHKYPAFAVTADIVIMTIVNGRRSVLLIQRGAEPYKGYWALPGGFVNPDEDATQAAWRELKEETNLDIDIKWLEQLGTYSTPKRDERMNVVSVAHLAILPNPGVPEGGDDAVNARFVPIDDILNPSSEEDRILLAFDHEEILRDALERAMSKLEYTPIATAFLGETFTISDLLNVYKIFWARDDLHAANFRRKLLTTPDFITSVGEKGAPHFKGRSAALYRKGSTDILHPALLRSKANQDEAD